MVGKIYKVYKITGYELTYYGSTKMTLNARKKSHKVGYERYKLGKLRVRTSSYDILEQGDDWDIELVEEVEEENQLLIREKYYIMNYECVNKYIPCRTEEERKEYLAQWYQDNKEYHNEKSAQWYQDNKEHKKEKSAHYREANKEKIKEYSAQWREANKEKIKERQAQYHEKNKEKIKERDAQYRAANRESINTKNRERARERVKCPTCSKEINRSSLTRHLKTQHKE